MSKSLQTTPLSIIIDSVSGHSFPSLRLFEVRSKQGKLFPVLIFFSLNRRSIFVPFLGTKIIFAFFANALNIFVPKNGTKIDGVQTHAL